MNRNQAKELLPIIKAFSEGKTIQYKSLEGIWEDRDKVSFNCEPECYRIKLEPNYRPFKDAEECWQEMAKHQPFGWLKVIGGNVRTEINYIHNEGAMFSCGSISFERMFDNYTFADGTPFGILEEE